MSNRIGKMVKDIQYATDLTIDQVAARIGYTRPHLNRLMKKGDSKKVFDSLQTEFAKELQNVTTSQNATRTPETAQNGQKNSKTIKDKEKDKVTTMTAKPAYEMQPPTNGANVKDATIKVQADVLKSQQELIAELAKNVMQLTGKLIEKK